MIDKAIFWDNDGVLVDSEHLYFEATKRALATVGVVPTMEEFARISLQQGRSMLQLAEAAGTPHETITSLRESRDRLYGELLRRDVQPRDGVRACLASVHGRAVNGVVTASQKVHFDIIHRKTDFLRYFDFVLTRDDFRRSKPHPEPYLAALRKTQLPPDRCIVVEDSERGVASAVAAGLRCIAFPSSLTVGGDFRAADRVVATAEELRAALSAWLGETRRNPAA